MCAVVHGALLLKIQALNLYYIAVVTSTERWLPVIKYSLEYLSYLY